VRQIKRCICIKTLYVNSGDIIYLCLILLNKKACSDKDVLTYIPVRGVGEPIVCTSYQQSAIAHGYVDNVADVCATHNDMCTNGTGAQCRSYVVVLSLHGYATHVIFDDYEKRHFMFMDYITYQGVAQVVAKQMMLQDLEHCFCKSHSSLEKFGFPTPDGVPTELEEATSLWMSPDALARQGQLLDSLNKTHPNNYEQHQAYKSIMESIVNFKDANQDDTIKHNFHFIGGPGGMGKFALFKKLHAAFRNNGILIMICTATSLASLSYEGATMAHSLFSYPVEDETDIDNQNLAGCNFNQECCDFLYEVSVIFWDKFISNDCILNGSCLGGIQNKMGYTPLLRFCVCR
jgi:hypothetical protein